MIFVTGDTHGEFGGRFNTKNFPEQKEMTKGKGEEQCQEKRKKQIRGKCCLRFL